MLFGAKYSSLKGQLGLGDFLQQQPKVKLQPQEFVAGNWKNMLKIAFILQTSVPTKLLIQQVRAAILKTHK